MSLFKRATCRSEVVTFTGMLICKCGNTLTLSKTASKSGKKCPICGDTMRVVATAASDEPVNVKKE